MNNFNNFGLPINNNPFVNQTNDVNGMGMGNNSYFAPTKPMDYDGYFGSQTKKPSFWDQTKMFFSQYGTKIFGWGATILGGLGAFALGKKFINLDVPYGKNAPKPSEDASLMVKAKYHLCTFLSDTVGIMKPYEAPAKTEEEDQKETDEIDVNTVVTKLENLINAPTPDINTLKSTVEILKNSLNGLKSSADLEHKIDELKETVNKTTSLTNDITNNIKRELNEIKTLLQPNPTVPVTSGIKPSKALEDIKAQCDKIFQSGLKFKTCKFNSMSLTKSNKESITLRNFVNLNAYTDDKINSTTIENATSIGIDNIEALEILRHSYYKNKDTISISHSTSTSTSNIISAENFFANIVSLAKFKLGNSDFNYDKQNIAIDSALKLFYDIAKNKFGNLNKAEDVDKSFIILSNEIDELININNINDENQKNAKLLKQYIAICKVETKVNILNNIQETEYDKTFTSAANLKNYLLSDDELKSLNTATKDNYVTKLSNIAKNPSVKSAEVKTAANAQIVMLTDDINVTQEMINAVDVTKLDATTKANYLTKLPDIATNASDTDARNTANAQTVMLTDPTKVQKDTINAVEVDKLDAATKAKYLTKLPDIAKNAKVLNVQNTANAQIAQIVMLTEDINVTPEMINAVDVTKLDDTTSPTKADYVTKLSEIVKDTSVNADVQNTANAQIAQTVILTVPKEVQKNTINAIDVTKLDETTSPKKSEYLIKLSEIVEDTSVNADVKNTANAQIVMLTDPTKVQKDTINAVNVTKLDETTKTNYLTKLSDIVQNAHNADVKTTANAQIVIATKNTDVTQAMINAVDVTKLNDTTSPTKAEYVKKLSDIAKESTFANVKTAAVEAKVNIFKNLDVTSLTDTTKFDTYKLSKEELDLLTDKSEYVDKLSNIAKKTTELEVKTTVFNALINQKDVKKQMINKNQLNITYKTLPLQYTFTLEKLSMPPADFSAYSKNTFILNGTQIYFKDHTKQYFKVTKFMIKT